MKRTRAHIFALNMNIKKILFCRLDPLYPLVAGGASISLHTLFFNFYKYGIEIKAIGGVSQESLQKMHAWFALHPELKVKNECFLNQTPPSNSMNDLDRWFCLHPDSLKTDYEEIMVEESLNNTSSNKEAFNNICHYFSHYQTSAVSKEVIMEYLLQEIDRFSPDVVISRDYWWQPVAMACKQCNVPFILHFNTMMLDPESVSMIIQDKIPLIVNSQFLQSLFKEAYGIDSSVFHSYIPIQDYKSERIDPRYITLINPAYEKGVDIFLEIAQKMPNEKFLCVQGWGTIPEIIDKIQQYPNIEYWDYQDDMRKVYGKTRLLLVPSVCEEAFGRVIVEAHINGIPVIASERGGIEEALGEGGLLIPYDKVTDIETWIKAIRALDNLEIRQELSKKAIENAKRFDVYEKVKDYISILSNIQKRYRKQKN